MENRNSILNSTKKILGLDESYDAFDLDVLTHINASFFTLSQLGVGPEGGFVIEDEEAAWSEFTDENASLNAVKTYVYLRVRLLFDPPAAPHHVSAIKEQITELEHRLLTDRNLTSWQTASSPPSLL